jgi:ribosome-binding protein aMBF1 (putative translation factor)
MNYGAEIAKLREAAGVTQSALAVKIKMRNDKLSRCESGVLPMSEAEYETAKAALDLLVSERQAAWVEARYQHAEQATS